MDMRKQVGRNVQNFGLASGLTQEQLAEKSGHSQQYISGLERGTRNLTVVSLFELAQALKVAPVDLIAPESDNFDEVVIEASKSGLLCGATGGDMR